MVFFVVSVLGPRCGLKLPPMVYFLPPSHEDHLDGLIKLFEIVGKVYEEKSTKEDSKGKGFSKQIEVACDKAEKGETDFTIDAGFDMDELFNG